jgi:hypothetical protein
VPVLLWISPTESTTRKSVKDSSVSATLTVAVP